MKKTYIKYMIGMCVGILLILFSGSMAMADFYVIAAGKKAKKTILVRPESTQSASGTALLNAMSSIIDASSTNRYLIQIEPGIYDIGTGRLVMQEYVDIQGSGVEVTTIKGSRCNGNVDNYVVLGADNAELRFLKVKHSGGDTWATGIYNVEDSPDITHVWIYVSGASYNYGVRNNISASPEMIDVTIDVSGGTSNYGVYNTTTCDPIMNNVRIEARDGTNNHGVHNSGGSLPEIANSFILATGGSTSNIGVYTDNNNGDILKIERCFIRGSDYALSTQDAGESTYIGSSRLSGTPVTGSGAHRCVGVYRNDYTLLNDDCSVP